VVGSLLAGLGVGASLAAAAWLASLKLVDVSIVDSVWSWLIFVPAATVAWLSAAAAPRGLLALALGGLWALRLSAHITLRHRGKPEDHRYQAIRRRNEPGFAFKSLYLVFMLQAALAWIVAAPLMMALIRPAPWRLLDAAGVALFAFGFGFEAVADAQLERFKLDPANANRVMQAGVWRYTRHPNYFGEFCLWWGLYLLALCAGAWWTVFSPLLMSLLLLKISGVALLEKDIGERRPEYRAYAERTNAFFPGPTRSRP
jgi:steroid 5-alpha reductase family enzyme